MALCTHQKFWLNETDSRELFDAALAMPGLKQRPVIVYEKEYLQPRLTGWCCDTGEPYAYSGQSTEAVPWPAAFLKVRQRLEMEQRRLFPSCLTNCYRTGADNVGKHRDNEHLFGKNLLIATISLGATRTFRIHSVADKAIKQDYELSDGDLLLMPPETNRNYYHSIPKTAKPIGMRISLTFRTMDR